METDKEKPDASRDYNGGLVHLDEYESCKHAFLKALKESEIYLTYLEKNEALEKEPEKKRMVNALRKRNYEFRNTEYIENYNAVLDEMAADMEEMRTDKVIDEFFAAELALCRLVQQLLDELMSSINMDMDFI